MFSGHIYSFVWILKMNYCAGWQKPSSHIFVSVALFCISYVHVSLQLCAVGIHAPADPPGATQRMSGISWPDWRSGTQAKERNNCLQSLYIQPRGLVCVCCMCGCLAPWVVGRCIAAPARPIPLPTLQTVELLSSGLLEAGEGGQLP